MLLDFNFVLILEVLLSLVCCASWWFLCWGFDTGMAWQTVGDGGGINSQLGVCLCVCVWGGQLTIFLLPPCCVVVGSSGVSGWEISHHHSKYGIPSMSRVTGVFCVGILVFTRIFFSSAIFFLLLPIFHLLYHMSWEKVGWEVLTELY